MAQEETSSFLMLSFLTTQPWSGFLTSCWKGVFPSCCRLVSAHRGHPSNTAGCWLHIHVHWTQPAARTLSLSRIRSDNHSVNPDPSPEARRAEGLSPCAHAGTVCFCRSSLTCCNLTDIFWICCEAAVGQFVRVRTSTSSAELGVRLQNKSRAEQKKQMLV